MADRLAEINQQLDELGTTTSPLGPATPGLGRTPAVRPPVGGEEFMARAKYGQLEPPPEELGFAAKALKNLWMGVSQGIVNELEAVDSIANIVSKVTGIDKPTAMQRAADWMRPTEADLQQGGNTLVNKVTRGIGQALPFLAEMAVGTKGVGMGLKALGAPKAIKVGSTAFTQGKRLLSETELARATGMAKVAGKTMHGALGLAEPVAFGTYGLTHEALSPEATVGSVVKRTLLDTAMGSALPLSHGLPTVARTVAPAGIGGLATAIEGGNLEDIVASAATMGALTMGPKAIGAARKLIVGEKPTPAVAPPPPKLGVSEQAQQAGGGTLGAALKRLKYDEASVDKWTPWQRQEMLRYTMMGAKEGEMPAPFKGVTLNENTGMLTIPFGKYTVEIPRENPKAPKAQATGAPTGGIKQTTGVDMTDPAQRKLRLENMPEFQLIFEEANAGDATSKLEAQQEIERRTAGRRRAATTATDSKEYGPWTKVMAYLDETHKGKKYISSDELTNMIADNVKAKMPLIEPGQEGNFVTWFIQNSGWKVLGKGEAAPVTETPLGVMGEVQGGPRAPGQEYQEIMGQRKVTLYRGQGEKAPDTSKWPEWMRASAGKWYTTDKSKAARYGNVMEIEVPESSLKGMLVPGTKDEYVVHDTFLKMFGPKVQPEVKTQAAVEVPATAIPAGGEVPPMGATQLPLEVGGTTGMAPIPTMPGEPIVVKSPAVKAKGKGKGKKAGISPELEKGMTGYKVAGALIDKLGEVAKKPAAEGIVPGEVKPGGAPPEKLSAAERLRRANEQLEKLGAFGAGRARNLEARPIIVPGQKATAPAQWEVIDLDLPKDQQRLGVFSTREEATGFMRAPELEGEGIKPAMDLSQYFKRPADMPPPKEKAKVVEEVPEAPPEVQLTPEVLERVAREAKLRGYPIKIDDLTYAKEGKAGRVLKKGEAIKEKFGVTRKEEDIRETTQQLIRFTPTAYGELKVAQEGVGSYTLPRVGIEKPAIEVPKTTRYTVESVINLPLPNADIAYNLGQSLRKQTNLESAIALWNKYLEGNNRYTQLTPKERTNVHSVEEMLENNLRKEAVESYLGAGKRESLLKEEISRRLLDEANKQANVRELSEEMGGMGRDWIAESVAMQKRYPQMSDTTIFENIKKSVAMEKKVKEVPFKEKVIEARPGTVVSLLLKSARGAKPTADLERRRNLIEKVLEMGEDIAIEADEDPRWIRWNRNQLNELSDEALERIIQYNILPRPFEVFLPKIREGQKLEAIKARIPITGKEGGKWSDVDELKSTMGRHSWDKDLLDSIDWEKAMELRDKGVKMIDFLPDRSVTRSIEEVGLEDPELQKLIGQPSENMSTYDKLLLRTGWKGIDPEMLVGPMVRAIFENRIMPFKEAVGRLLNGKPIPTLPAEYLAQIYKGYNPPEFKLGGFKKESLTRFVVDKVANAIGAPGEPEKIKESYPRETELGIIDEVFAGLRPEALEDPAQQQAIQLFKDEIIKNFEKLHYPVKGKTNKDLLPFAEAIGEGFARAYGMLTSGTRRATGNYLETINIIRSQLAGGMRELYERGRLRLAKEIEQVQAPERFDPVAKKALKESGITKVSTAEDILQPGGAPYRPELEGDKVLRVEKMLEERGLIPKGPPETTEADRLVNEANKTVDTFRDYRNIVELMAKNAGEFEEIGREINRLAMTKASLKDAAPETLAPVDEKLNQIMQRREQLITDNDYLGTLKDFFSRTGKPYTGGETYLEETLSSDSHGVDGTVISKGTPTGAVFYIVQGPNGEPMRPGQPGHKIYAKANVTSRRTKGEITSWEMPEGTDYRAEDALYNDILERFLWREKPIAITHLPGVADAVANRRPSSKYAALKSRPDFDIFKLLPEDSAAYRDQKKKYHDQLVAAAIAVEGKKYGPLTREKKMEFLRRAQSLTDKTIGYDLEMISKDPASIGLSDPALAAGKVDYMPLLERIGDPTQSRIAPVAYVGNLALQTELSIAKFMKQYGDMAEQYLGAFKHDAVAKQKIFHHLVANAEAAVRAKHPDWVLKDTPENAELLKAAHGYNLIMNDMADLFDLETKKLYRKNYVTLNYNLGDLWDKLYADKFRAVQQPHQAPDSILSKIAPEDFYALRNIALTGKVWEKMDPVEKAAVMNKFFSNNVAYADWETLPDAIRARIPKQKFIKYFQHRSDDAANLVEFANDDIWDVLNSYITTVVHDGVITDFFLPKARAIVNPMPAAGVNERFSVRGYLDSYIKQVAGFGRKTPGTMYLDSLFQSINKWFGAQVFPESGMPAEAANLYQQMLYRGALGVDTAVRNLTQSIYTIAELGPNVWMKGLINYVGNKWGNTDAWKKFDEHRKLIEEFYESRVEMLKKSDPTLYDRWKTLDRKVTSIALHPMHITENINRGIAYFGGLVEAKNLGLDFDTAHIVGLDRGQKYAHPYEMSEAEWQATKRMYESQFGYGITHTPPMFTGPAAAWLKPFLTFPTRSLNFVSNLGKGALGIERWGEAAYKEPWKQMLTAKAPEGKTWLAGPQGQFARFLALTGFMVYAPTIIASTLGIDTGYLWGKGLFPNNFTPMWMQMMEDVYTGVFGGLGKEIPPTAKERIEAMRRLKNNAFMLMIPQWRFAKKTANVLDNMEKGYYGMGPKDLPAHETTTAKEIVNLLGFPPYTKDAKQLVWDAYRERGDLYTMKANAIQEAAKHIRDDGDYEKASKVLNKFYQRYGVHIGDYELRDYLRYQNTTDAYEEAEKNLPEPLRREWGPKFREAREKHMKGGVARKSLWTNPDRESAIAVPGPPEIPPEYAEAYSRMTQEGVAPPALSPFIGE